MVNYKTLYRLFDGMTPLKKDCGVLCSERCCSGDERTGMLLFPGEETALEVIESGGVKYAVCSGKCSRNERPLSCRIFPFFPAVDKDGKVSVTIDYRGFGICPLVRNAPGIAFDTRFLRHVKVAGIMLARDPECRKLMEEITGDITDAVIMTDKLEGLK